MKELPTRKHPRLKCHGYSRNGAYFITICVKDSHELLWDEQTIVGAAIGRPPLSEVGLLVETKVKEIENVYNCVKIENYVIMPIHRPKSRKLGT